MKYNTETIPCIVHPLVKIKEIIPKSSVPRTKNAKDEKTDGSGK
jgi:hypothetical protein